MCKLCTGGTMAAEHLAPVPEALSSVVPRRLQVPPSCSSLCGRPGECLPASESMWAPQENNWASSHLPPHWVEQIESSLISTTIYHGTPLLGTGPLPGVGPGVSSRSRGASATEVLIPVFLLSLWTWSQSASRLYAFYQSRCGLFFKSLLLVILFS